MKIQTAHLFESLTDKAIGDLLSSWAHAKPDSAVLAFVAEGDRDSIPTLQRFSAQAGLPLLGAVFPELLDGEHFRRRGAWLLHLRDTPAYRIVEGLSSLPPGDKAAIDRMAETMAGLKTAGAHRTLLIIFDAMVPTIESWLSALYERLGRQVRYLGANAGSETFQPIPCLFDTERTFQDAVLVAAMPNLPGGVLAHGYQPPEQMLIATSTQGNRIDSIDWRPAFQVYAELVQRDYGAQITSANFYQYGVHFPFGILRATGEVLVRVPVSLSDNGAVFCVGQVPENAILTVLHASSAESPVAEIVPSLTDVDCDFALTFYCAGRRMHDLGRATKELHELGGKVPVPLIGALSLGEIGGSTRDGYPLFHNAAVVCAPWTGQ